MTSKRPVSPTNASTKRQRTFGPDYNSEVATINTSSNSLAKRVLVLAKHLSNLFPIPPNQLPKIPSDWGIALGHQNLGYNLITLSKKEHMAMKNSGHPPLDLSYPSIQSSLLSLSPPIPLLKQTHTLLHSASSTSTSQHPYVCWNSKDSAPQIVLGKDRLTAGGKIDGGFRMVRGSKAVSEGCWYFECEVLGRGAAFDDLESSQVETNSSSSSSNSNSISSSNSNNGHVRIGFSMRTGDLQAPVGFDKWSYAYRDVSGSRIHQSRREDTWSGLVPTDDNDDDDDDKTKAPEKYLGEYGKGDVVGLMICLKEKGEKTTIDKSLVSVGRGKSYGKLSPLGDESDGGESGGEGGACEGGTSHALITESKPRTNANFGLTPITNHIRFFKNGKVSNFSTPTTWWGWRAACEAVLLASLAARFTRCSLHSLLASLAARFTRCSLLASLAARFTRCSLHSLLASLAARFTRCSLHSLLAARCSLHSLLASLAARFTRCSLHSLLASLRFTSLHFASLHFASLRFTSLHFASLRFTSLHFASLHSPI